MRPADHRFGRLTGQHIHHMLGTKPLAGAEHGRQHLLRFNGAVEHARRRDAIVAVPAWAGQILTEAGEQCAGAALRGFGQRDHGFQPLPCRALLRFGGG